MVEIWLLLVRTDWVRTPKWFQNRSGSWILGLRWLGIVICTPDRPFQYLRHRVRFLYRCSQRRSIFRLMTQPPETSGVCFGSIFEIRVESFGFSLHVNLSSLYVSSLIRFPWFPGSSRQLFTKLEADLEIREEYGGESVKFVVVCYVILG